MDLFKLGNVAKKGVTGQLLIQLNNEVAPSSIRFISFVFHLGLAKVCYLEIRSKSGEPIRIWDVEHNLAIDDLTLSSDLLLNFFIEQKIKILRFGTTRFSNGKNSELLSVEKFYKGRNLATEAITISAKVAHKRVNYTGEEIT